MADIAKEAGLKADELMLVAASQLFSYLWNTAWAQAQGTLEGDADALHDMRVAMRRLRTALQSFEGTSEAPLLPPHLRRELARQRRKLGKLGDALGAVRDFDVLKGHLKDYLEEHEVTPTNKAKRVLPTVADGGLEDLKDFLKSEREAAFPHMVEQIQESMEPGGLRENFARFALGLPAASAPPLLLKGAAQLIVPLRINEVLHCAPLLHDSHDAIGHHEFRKALRRLRYSLEMLAPCLSVPVGPHIKRLTQLQDLLGEMQDRQVLCGTAQAAFKLDEPIHFKPIKGNKQPQLPASNAAKQYEFKLPKKHSLPPDVIEFLAYGESRRHELLKQAR
ncbi:MAG: CHAD domain-containing protein, partial [Abitibacteriaceae bacterium]|nr:CHAD domain-containing protein [Abditibacteriaceae bacterium]